MAKIKALSGMNDMLPANAYKWEHIKKTCMEVARLHGFRAIRTPAVEYTELFSRGVGETTDVVQKEMYTFNDRGGRSLTMRPEMTAGVMRCAIEHGLTGDTLPVKACYIEPCYRAERPQAGRYREFFQFGAELLGTATPAADADMISMAADVLNALGIEGVTLELNSIGCPECRKNYHEALKAYFNENIEELCETCRGRLEKNPMRILDCKSPVCKGIAANAPFITDYLCEECENHFKSVQELLHGMGIEFTINPRIVRGLDYYTRTVFEFVSDSLGSQSTCCGGGRYDGLSEAVGGPKLPSIGFAMGLERIMLIMEAQNTPFPEEEKTLLYIAALGDKAVLRAASLASTIRAEGFSVETDLSARSLKAQMKYADKIGAQYVVILGDSELESGVVKLRKMADGTETEVDLDSGLLEELYNLGIMDSLGKLEAMTGDLDDLGSMARLFGGEE